MSVDQDRAERAIRELLIALGTDPASPSLARTPERVARLWLELFAGVDADPVPALAAAALEDVSAAGPVAFLHVPFRSICEHHLLKFAGSVSIVYLPGRAVAGLGALVAAVEVLAARPQLQERLTDEIADAIERGLGAHGVLVHAIAEHDCVSVRGPRIHGASVATLAARGVYATDAGAAEARALIGVGTSAPDVE